MAALVSCCVLLLVAASFATSQWSKPVASSADRRISEDWVPVASSCPTCPKEAESQASAIFQPPPAYQPSAQSSYIQQTLSAQQREIHNHFNTQGLVPGFSPNPQQLYNQPQLYNIQQPASTQHLHHQQPSAPQQVVAPQLSYQQSSAPRQVVAPQQSYQQPSAPQQVVAPQLSHQQPSAPRQVVAPQQNYQQPSALQQVVTQLSHKQPSAPQQVVIPQVSHQQPSATQQVGTPEVSHQKPSATQQVLSTQLSQQQSLSPQRTSLSQQQRPTVQHQQPPVAQQFSRQQQNVPKRARRPPIASTSTPAPQEEVQLLYVPVETLRQQQQAALMRQQQQLTQQLQSLQTTTYQPSTTPEPYQPPLSVYMGPQEGHHVKITDVVKVLKEAKTISVLDTVGPDSPQVFVGPSNLHAPAGYTKFELPYLSALESNRVERKVDKPPFFVAPLSFKPPAGYSKIPFPAPHVGSVVVTNVTTELLHEKDFPRKAYSLPAELPPINPELPTLVNSLQDQRNVLLVPQQQAVTKFLQAVQQVGLETSTERYTRNKQSRYQDTDETTKPARLAVKQTRHRFQETTTQPQYSEQNSPRLPKYSAQQTEVSTLQPQYKYPGSASTPRQQVPEDTIHIPTLSPQHANPAEESKYIASQEEFLPQYSLQQTKAKHVPQDTSAHPSKSRTVIPTESSAYSESTEQNPTHRPQYVASHPAAQVKHPKYNIPQEESQYLDLKSTVPEDRPKHAEELPIRQPQYPVTEVSAHSKYSIPRQEIAAARRPQYTAPEEQLHQTQYSVPAGYTTTSEDIPLRYTVPEKPQDDIPLRQKQYPVLEAAKYIHSQGSVPLQPDLEAEAPDKQTKYTSSQEQNPIRKPQYSVLEEEPAGNPTKYSSVKDDIPLRQIQYSAPELVKPSKYGVIQEDVPQRQAQSLVLQTQTPARPSKYSTVQEDSPPRPSQYSVPEGATSTRYNAPQDEINQQPPQYHAPEPSIPVQPPRYSIPQEEVQSRQPQYSDIVVTGKLPNPQADIPVVPQYDTYQSQYPPPDTEALTEPVPISTTTPAPLHTTSSRRNRGRHRHSSFSTTTSIPRTRASYSRGRRPTTRTTSEAPQVPPSAAAQLGPFESSRQPSERAQSHRFETPRRDRTRSRTRGRSTTTTASPLYNTDLYQEELYSPATSTQHSRTDTVTERFVSPHQQQAPSGQVTRTQLPGITQTPSQYYDGPSAQVQHGPLAQMSRGEQSQIHISSGNRPETQPQIPQEPIAHSDDVGYSQFPTGPDVNIPGGHVTETEIASGKLDRTQNQIALAPVDNYQTSSGQLANNQIPSAQVRHNPAPPRQVGNPQVPSDYYDAPLTSADIRQVSSTEAGGGQQDGFLQHELPEAVDQTTQTQYSSLSRGRPHDPQIVTSDRSPETIDITQRPTFVRIRGRLRGRPREQLASITTVTPDVYTITPGRKHTNFLNRGSARKTLAPTSTPTAETTTPGNDKIYTVRPARRPQPVQTKLTTRGRIRRPTRPTTTPLPTTSDHRLNEVFTTEIVPTTRRSPDYDPVQQYQPQRQQYQLIERHREYPEYEPVQQYYPDQQYQTIDRFRSADQTSLPSDNRPLYEEDGPERGAESQWSTRTLVPSNAIPSVDKPSTPLLAVTTTEQPLTTEEPEVTTEVITTTTVATPLLLTTTETSKPGPGRRRGSWVRVRVRPQQQQPPQDIFETAESQNVATVAAANEIPDTIKQVTKSPGHRDIIGVSINSPGFQGGYMNEETATKSTDFQDVLITTEDPSTFPSRVTSDSSTREMQEGDSSKETTSAEEVTTRKYEDSYGSSKKASNPPVGLDYPWNEDDSTTTQATQLDDDSTTALPEEQDSYLGSLLSSLGYYGKPEQTSDKTLNWGGYEDWWGKTYANHRPYYNDEQLGVPLEEKKKRLPASTSIWDMDSFREYEEPLNVTTTESPGSDDYQDLGVEQHSVKKANPQHDKKGEEPLSSGLNSTTEVPEARPTQESVHRIEETTAASGGTEQRMTTEPSTSTESTTEHAPSTPTPSSDNVISTSTEATTEPSAPLTSEPNIKRTDTRSLMARILGTTTSTKISHETEICYRGRCIKTKTKDSDIDQLSTD